MGGEKMKKIVQKVVLGLGIVVFLGGCTDTNGEPIETPPTESSEDPDNPINPQNTEVEEKAEELTNDDTMEGMHHGGEIPAEMKEAADPQYPVGSTVVLTTDHMEGMNGAEAVVSGAYDTVIYEVTYQPVGGGEVVPNHKWVVQEELRDQETEAKPGDKVVLEAEHMEGMKGAEATVDNVVKGTVYAVDYTPTTGGERIEDHMWVTGDEMRAKE